MRAPAAGGSTIASLSHRRLKGWPLADDIGQVHVKLEGVGSNFLRRCPKFPNALFFSHALDWETDLKPNSN
jgi:hypothetical protein